MVGGLLRADKTLPMLVTLSRHGFFIGYIAIRLVQGGELVF